MYALTPELALIIKQSIHAVDIENEMSPEDVLELIESQDDDTGEMREHMCSWDEAGFTVGTEPVDLASEIEPSVYDRYMPNDGTPRIEHRLRRQGLRKAADSQREEVQELRVELYGLDRRIQRVHILRQKGGDVVLN
jgi:hypothetical protein